VCLVINSREPIWKKRVTISTFGDSLGPPGISCPSQKPGAFLAWLWDQSHLATCIRSNHDIAWIPTSSKALAYVYYLTNYSTKADISPQQILIKSALIADTMRMDWSLVFRPVYLDIGSNNSSDKRALEGFWGIPYTVPDIP
jgi:hypothetical protein